MLDYSKIKNVQVSDIFSCDAPDYSDAYISYAEYDGEEMTDQMLDEINQDRDFVYESVLNQIY